MEITDCDNRTGAKGNGLTVSVLIATRNRPAHLANALRAVCSQSHKPLEIVVVDNAPGNSAVARVIEQFPVTYVLEPSPGVSKARNAGIRASRGEIIACLDDDSVPEPDWIATLLQEFADPRVGVVTGRVIRCGSGADAQAIVVRGASTEGNRGGKQRFVLTRQSRDWIVRSAYGGLGIGANMAFRKTVLERIGGFDPRLGPGAAFHGEEYYAFFRALSLGEQAVYTPKAVVQHPYRPRTDDVVSRYLTSRRSLTALATLMLVRHPGSMPATFLYFLRRMMGLNSWAERRGLLPRPPTVSRWQAVKAFLSGPVIYFQNCSRGPQHAGGGRTESPTHKLRQRV